MRLIVNADDLGASPAGNRAIFNLMEQGTVRSASILANGAALDDAVAQIPNFPHCSFGIHLNVTHGFPVSAQAQVAPLLDQSGRFKPSPELGRLRVRKSIRRGVLDEWRSQFAKLVEAGVRVSHIDSHHHIHTYPSLFGTLRIIQREFGVRRVRLTRTTPDDAGKAGTLARRAWTSVAKLDGAETADYFCSLSDYRRLLQLRPFRRDATIELMVHPGLQSHAEESNLLRSTWWTSHCAENQLISYDEL